jgi:hypothetical protein
MEIVPALFWEGLTMQVDLDAVIAAIEGERLGEAVGEYDGSADYERALDDAIAAINALPASNARIEAGDAMKVAILNIADIWNAPTERANPAVTAAMAMWINAIEALDTAAIVGDGV